MPSRNPSSLLKNLEIAGFSFFRGSLLERCVGVGSVCIQTPGWLRRDQFGNADQIVGDQIEQEIGGDASYAAMFGLAHGAVLLAPTEDALGHRPA